MRPRYVGSLSQPQYIEQLPIREIDFSDATDKARHNKMISLVHRMQELQRRSVAAKKPNDKVQL
jgi:hypothetical protein